MSKNMLAVRLGKNVPADFGPGNKPQQQAKAAQNTDKARGIAAAIMKRAGR